MRYMIATLTAVLATIGAALLILFGMDHMSTHGATGLHPGIAFPCATLLVLYVLCCIGYVLLVDEIHEEDARHALMVKHY